MALQQENAALKNKSQSLQQQRENPLCKAANRAYLREFTAYKTESLVEFPDGRYHLVKENPLGELYKVVKPVSDCTEFSARYAIDPRDGSTSIEVRYRLPNGTLSGFRVADDKFQQNALIQGFYKSGGTLRCGKDGPRLFYMLVAQLLSKHEIYFQPIPGWNINVSRWFFKESAGCEAPLDSPILRPDALTSEDQMMMAAVIGLSFLKTRLPENMQPTKPFAVISESFSITTEITLNCKLAELKKQLNHHRDDLLIHVRGGFASNRYQKATNYDYLSDEAEKGSTSRSIYIVQAKELTPEIREHCIPIQLNPAEACSATTGVDSVTWGDLISLVEGNPNEFDSRVYRAYKEERDRMEGSSFCQEIAVLRAVSEIICWTFSQKASLSEEKVRDAYKTAFDHYPSRWDSMLNTTASDCFRNALYAAAREQTIRFRDIDDLDETYCKEKEVLYDEYKLYLTLDLVKRLAAKHMPEFLTSDVLAQLTEAGILSSSIVKTLTLSTGHSKNVRLRSINRSFVNEYGQKSMHSLARIRKVLKNSRSTFNFTPELILPVYSSLDQAAAENPRRGNAWQFSSLSKKSPCSHWTLDTLCRLITFAHRCPLNLRHWQSGMISTLNLWPPTFSILNFVEAIQSPPMTRPMVFARSLDKIIVLALLKLHRSQPRSKRLWSAGKFVPISSQAFLRH